MNTRSRRGSVGDDVGTEVRRGSRLLAGACSVVMLVAACSDGNGEVGGEPADGGGTIETAPPAPPQTDAAPDTAPDSAPAPATTEPEPTSASTEPATTTTTSPPLGVDWDAVERADPSVFDYDPVRPVEYEVVSTQEFLGAEMQRIKFESPVGGMAYGYLSLPVSDPVDAGILWGHGAPVDGTDNFVPMAVFACAGVPTAVVDAPYARPGALRAGKEFLFTEQDRDEQIQLIIDMRRALDLLTDLGAAQFGFGGISYGSAMGGLLLGVDDRISAAVFMLGNGGLVERFTDEEGAPAWPLTDRSDEEIEVWIEAMLPIEPIRFIGDSTAEVLFMNGEEDPLIPPVEAERFHAAAPAGAELIWMEAAHDVPFEHFEVHNNWLGDRLGVDRARLDACTAEMFPNGWDDLG